MLMRRNTNSTNTFDFRHTFGELIHSLIIVYVCVVGGTTSVKEYFMFKREVDLEHPK